ncbi:hypothetical protein [Frigoribacterium sp. Leaf263]|uniref:hypothetical protein n=1 Tax=Frigoribacterium sp. Leaf263 TaxID=1736313 RepID=UPI000B191999|nr:hypothetical protein [Frigoribacterium sp. Leaf263]
MPIPTRGFARIVAYVLLISVASRASTMRRHVGAEHRHGAAAAVPGAHPTAATTEAAA